jgi:hypothetical protein
LPGGIRQVLSREIVMKSCRRSNTEQRPETVKDLGRVTKRIECRLSGKLDRWSQLGGLIKQETRKEQLPQPFRVSSGLNIDEFVRGRIHHY